jgi:hypothetical protein
VGGYVDVRGLRTYYEVRGAGRPVVVAAVLTRDEARRWRAAEADGARA